MNLPCLVADGDVGWFHHNVGIGHSLVVLAEGRGGVKFASCLVFIAPFQ